MPAGRRTARQLQIGIPGTTRYTFDGAIATVLGPRDDAWLEAAVADTRVATDVTPWWADTTDGQIPPQPGTRPDVARGPLARSRRSRRERELLDEVHRILTRAYPTDPLLPYPWRAWAELIELRGIDDPMSRQVMARVERDGGEAARIGYRRAPVTIRHEGWALEIPGSYAERRTPEEWWGGGLGRSITLAAVQTATDGGAMGAQAFVDHVGGDLGPDAHRPSGRRRDRPREAVDGHQLRASRSASSTATRRSSAPARRSGSCSTIPGDWQWALDMWRSLAPG